MSDVGPFQLLIVGDRSCRPWANIPAVKAGNLAPGATLSGTVEFVPRRDSRTKARNFPAATPPEAGEFYSSSTACECLGPGEDAGVRHAAGGRWLSRTADRGGGGRPARTQGRMFVPVQVDNHGRAIELAVWIGTKEGPVETSKSAEHEPSPKPAPPNPQRRRLAARRWC